MRISTGGASDGSGMRVATEAVLHVSRVPGTFPPQPGIGWSGTLARKIGTGVLGGALAVLGGLVVAELVRRRPKAAEPQQQAARIGENVQKAACLLHAGAATLSLSVLADSSIEHYRGAFHNPGMYLPPIISSISLAMNLHGALDPTHERLSLARGVVAGLALVTGVGGTGFHLFNVVKREGGFSLLNLFYGAPLGAPSAIMLGGLYGLAAVQLITEARRQSDETLLGLPAGPVLAASAAVGMLGTVAEVALLHFRGAFHDPFMFVPVTVPPLAGAVLAAAIFFPEALKRASAALLYATVAAGVGGVGFHVYGVQRNMGGWRNWSQNLLQGPPVPAPPAFAGVAMTGLAALAFL